MRRVVNIGHSGYRATRTGTSEGGTDRSDEGRATAIESRTGQDEKRESRVGSGRGNIQASGCNWLVLRHRGGAVRSYLANENHVEGGGLGPTN